MPKDGHVLALDAGSTGVRALVFDRGGRVAGKAYREVAASHPRPGWVEHDAEALWADLLDVARRAIAAAGISGSSLAAIGVTGQRSTAVAWSRSTGRALHAALSWQDLRTVDRCAELLAEGHFATPLAAVTKLEWLLRNAEPVRAANERGDAVFGTLESFFVWKLTGGRVFATDPSFASTTCLFDFFQTCWSTPLIDHLGFSPSALPEIRESSERLGPSDAELFGAAIPVAAIAGDQQAAVFGELCLEPGQLKISYGTSAMGDLNVGTSLLLSSQGAFPLVLWKRAGEVHYCLEGNAISAGSAAQWLRDGLGILSEVGETGVLARSVADTGGVWAVPAFQGLGTPHLDPAARAAIGGLSRASSRAHVARALLEGIALRCAEVFEALAADCPTGRPTVLRADGGAAANDVLLQIQADVLGIAVERPETLEAAAAGVAYLAGLAVGFWGSVEELRSIWRLGARFEPSISQEERDVRRARFAKQVQAVREVATL